jgi:alcohol dehydrogenase class IV
MVVACGGGAAIDLGKAIAALAANPGEATDYLEIIGRNLPLRSASLPLIAIPTTAGTGAEATRNAVLKSRQHKVKVSLRDPRMLPAAALVDPELTLNLSPELTAATGMDALTQVLEPFVSPRSNPITDGFCREGLNRCAWALRRAYNNGQDLDAREAMCVASLMGGLALANAGLGAVHGFASPIGGMFEAPHGAVCAALLAPVWDVNTRALQQREPGCKTLERYLEAARILTGRPGASIEHGSKWLTDLARHLQIPGLRVWGIGEMDVAVIAAKSARASSMKANPIELTTAELEETLRSAL